MTVVGHCLPRMTREDMSLLALDDMARHVTFSLDDMGRHGTTAVAAGHHDNVFAYPKQVLVK
jgi:hypothetical protein